ncbi:methylthioribose-1-phosphate isomerase isoform X6 [Rhipicephalus microplus]|uniref:methylthioribose-1-phosphate isomerase isoform X6 n=1 Tax=Rhipicephalus microplus TaxID=6941 RepID=UPI003F6B02F8
MKWFLNHRVRHRFAILRFVPRMTAVIRRHLTHRTSMTMSTITVFRFVVLLTTIGGMLEAIRYRAGMLEILDQLRLPHESHYLTLPDAAAAWEAIHSMKVRGAPAIAIVAALGLASEMTLLKLPASCPELAAYIRSRLEYLKTSRPTAVNLANMATHFTKMADALAKQEGLSVEAMRDAICAEAEGMLAADVAANRAIGRHGAEHMVVNCRTASDGKLGILTHCNTGSLATAGYGTALGTYQLAICAKHHGVPFYVASPTTTVDRSLSTGREIPIEERPAHEMTCIQGVQLTPSGKTICMLTQQENMGSEGIKCWNPAFDVTPNELITGGIITEKGVFPASRVLDSLRAS